MRPNGDRGRSPGELWVLSFAGKYLARGRNIPRLRAGEDTGPYGMGKRMLCIVGAEVLIRPAFLGTSL